MKKAAQINGDGATYPDYNEILQALIADYKAIYGADVYLGADSQDYQLIAIQALAIYDGACADVDSYNSLSPSTAQGDALSRNVKINGIRRQIATYSTADLEIGGTAGTVITNGQAKDSLGRVWLLPETVTIDQTGKVTGKATAKEIGAIRAAAKTIIKIETPTLGWQTVNNPDPAVAGRAVETDAELRARQRVSTANPSQSLLEGITGAIANIKGVSAVIGYDNDETNPDKRGIPGRTISIIVDGGDENAIANAMFWKKTPGVGTYGTTEVTVYDIYGVPYVVRFWRPIPANIAGRIAVKALNGYNTETGKLIAGQVAKSIAANGIGQTIYLTRLYPQAYLGGAAGQTYVVTGIYIAVKPLIPDDQDIALAFNQQPLCDSADILIEVVP